MPDAPSWALRRQLRVKKEERKKTDLYRVLGQKALFR